MSEQKGEDKAAQGAVLQARTPLGALQAGAERARFFGLLLLQLGIFQTCSQPAEYVAGSRLLLQLPKAV